MLFNDRSDMKQLCIVPWNGIRDWKHDRRGGHGEDLLLQIQRAKQVSSTFSSMAEMTEYYV